MKYQKIVEGKFLSRPNRFIAYVEMEGRTERVHVKNTGRCRELLTPQAAVFLAESDNPARTTRFDLVAVQKGRRLINMDSQAPNQAVAEWLKKKILFPDLLKLTPEYRYRNSRIDFLAETAQGKILIEVKGVTLEKDGAVYFPDAPSVRAVKHMTEMTEALREGYQAYVILVVQMKGVEFFAPNRETHPAFAEALVTAREAGVGVLALDCMVTPDSMEIDKEVPVRLSLLDEIAAPLLKWYDAGRRSLPWREDPTPYHVWVSEIMLQQTRVEAVKPYYERFMTELPDIESLAAVEEERLLKLWEGLGYYNRARNLQKAAKQIMTDYQGKMPTDYEQLKKLPGIGSYTAGAVASIAFNQRVPAVDGNVLRVLARLRADKRNIAGVEAKPRTERELQAILPVKRPGDFNQALMELGAVVCIPNGMPQCLICPWEGLCLAHMAGREKEFPVKTPPKARKKEEKTVLLLWDGNRVALKKRPNQGLLAGLYEFPALTGHMTTEEVLTYLKEIGLNAVHLKALPASKHIFTHKEWDMQGYMVRVDELAERKGAAGELLFVETAAVRERFPIPAAYAAFMEYLYP